MLFHSNFLIIRCENDIQPQTQRATQFRRAPSFSGPLTLPNRASANSLSAPIRSSGGDPKLLKALEIIIIIIV